MSDIIRAIVSFFTAVFALPSLILCGTDNINDNVYGKVKPDTWVAVDGLGRSLPTYSEVGETDNKKFVGLFYWTWHYNFASEFEADNVTEILKKILRQSVIFHIRYGRTPQAASPIIGTNRFSAIIRIWMNTLSESSQK